MPQWQCCLDHNKHICPLQCMPVAATLTSNLPAMLFGNIQAIYNNIYSSTRFYMNVIYLYVIIFGPVLLADCPCCRKTWIDQCNAISTNHTMDMLWEKFQWILPLYMKPISFQSKASVVCSVTAAVFMDFCLKKLNVFSQYIGQKTNEYMNSTEQIPRNWNLDQRSMLITS